MVQRALAITSVLALSAVSYLVYFDYQRRNSTEFRRQLRKSAKQHQKVLEEAAEQAKNASRSQIETALRESLASSPLPQGLKEREEFFVAEVSRADDLLRGGEANHLDAALAYYRALSIYPNPVDLLNIYDKSIKEPVMEILRALIILEPPPAIASVLSAGLAGAAGPEPVDLNVE